MDDVRQKIMIRLYLLLALVAGLLRTDAAIPPDILEGLSRSEIGETGGFQVRGVEESRYYDYLRANWRMIMDDPGMLPLRKPDHGVIRGQAAVDATVAIFAVSCEALPPIEYLDFLDEWLDAFAEGKISYAGFKWMTGVRQKEDFLSVNYEHPRVQTILRRAVELAPEVDDGFISLMKSSASGKLAEDYMYGREDDAPLPETLPGIKLRKPWGSTITKLERLGRRVELPARFDGMEAGEEHRPQKRPPEQGVRVTRDESRSTGLLAAVVIMIISLGVLFWTKRRKAA